MAAGKDADNSKKRPIIIKRIKKGGGGHHGGAWKVAYADFVTAMMAFFLLLWLLNQVPQEKLKGLSDYFTPTVGIKGMIGQNEKGMSGDVDAGPKMKSGGTPSVVFGAPPTTGDVAKAPETDIMDVGDYYQEKLQVTESKAEEISSELEKKKFERIQDEINKAIEDSPELKEFKKNMQVTQTQEGLQIEVTDLEGVSMFELGSSSLKTEIQPLLAKVTEVIRKTDNKVAIVGHTDSLSYSGKRDYSNWELSSDRANASRRFLEASGLDDGRIYRVEGKADKDHFDEKDPISPRNRRISIILLKKSITDNNPKSKKDAKVN